MKHLALLQHQVSSIPRACLQNGVLDWPFLELCVPAFLYKCAQLMHCTCYYLRSMVKITMCACCLLLVSH